jgi:hypothetical protein
MNESRAKCGAGRSLRARIFACALAVTTLAPLSLAVAQSAIATRQLGVRFQSRAPVLSFSARDFLNADVRKKLDSGLPQRIVTRVYSYSEKGERPIAVAATSCRVVYDLWEGVYRVEEQTETSDRARTERDRTAAVAACLEPRTLVVGDGSVYAAHAGKRVYFAVIVELNPLSADTVQRIRRWLSRSSGELGGDAFFGSFVSIFVSRKLGAAERALTFRSALVDVPP